MALVQGGALFKSSTIISNGTALNVTANTLTTVDTYTASGNDVKITKIVVSGDANSTWGLFIDTVEKITWRVADGNKTRDFDFISPLLLADGETIDIKVTHYFNSETADFSTSILGFI